MTRTQFLFTAAGAAAAPVSLRAQQAASGADESKQARGKRVVDEAIAALGGAKFTSMRDRTERGRAYSFYRDRLTGLSRAAIYTRYVRRPDPPTNEPAIYMRERQSFIRKDKEEYATMFDEKDGWQITFRGVRPVPTNTLERWRDSTRRNIFYILRQRLGEPGLVIESKGTEIFANQSVEVVEFFDTENSSIIVYFSRTTKLPIRQIYLRRDPLTREKHEEVTLFSKYRNSSGVMWPWAITRTRDGDKIFEIFSDNVTVDTNLDDSYFTLPANLQVLPPAK